MKNVCVLSKDGRFLTTLFAEKGSSPNVTLVRAYLLTLLSHDAVGLPQSELTASMFWRSASLEQLLEAGQGFCQKSWADVEAEYYGERGFDR
jgi:hypothetical protein